MADTLTPSNGINSILKAGNTAFAFPSSKAFTDFFNKFFANVQTIHMFGPREMQMKAIDEVDAVWGMEDQIILQHTAGLIEIRGGGRTLIFRRSIYRRYVCALCK
jgi:hypothetical protein